MGENYLMQASPRGLGRLERRMIELVVVLASAVVGAFSGLLWLLAAALAGFNPGAGAVGFAVAVAVVVFGETTQIYRALARKETDDG